MAGDVGEAEVREAVAALSRNAGSPTETAFPLTSDADPVAAMSAVRVLALRADSPTRVVNYIASGGSVRKLVNIARAENVIINVPRPVPVSTLPPDNPHFTGRRDEIAAILSVLSPSSEGAARTVLLRDGPGVGKTALALHIAHLLAPHYPQHRLFARLTDAADQPVPSARLLEVLLEAIGVERSEIPAEESDRQRLYQQELSRSLIVLDGAVDEAQVRPLLPERSGCGAIVTSRRQLVGLDMAFTHDLERLSDEDAFALMERLVSPGRVAGEPQAARSIVQSCGNLPLAIWIAGATLNTTSRRRVPLARFARELSDERQRLDLLKAGDQEVRASFDLSYRQLSDEAARLFRYLSLARIPDAGVEMLAELAARGIEQVEALRDALADAHLVELTGGQADRLRLHDLLRLFSAELTARHDSDDDRRAALERVYRWTVARNAVATSALEPVAQADKARDAAVPVRRKEAALNWLDLERRCLMALLRQASIDGHDGVVISLAVTMTRYFEVGSHWGDWVTAGEAALVAARRIGDRKAEGEVLASLARVARLRRRPDLALTYFDGAIDIFSELGEAALHASATTNRGVVFREQHRFVEATASFDEALQLYHDLGDRRGVAETLNNMGYAFRYQRRNAEAIRCHERSIPVFEELGDCEGLGWAYSNLIAVYRFQRRFDESIRCFRAALDSFAEVQQRHGAAWAYNHIGAVYREQGNLDEAVASHRRAEEVFHHIGDGYGEGWALTYLAVAEQEALCIDAALDHAERAVQVFSSLPDRYGEAWARLYLSDIYLDARRTADAATACRDALRLFDDLSNDPGRARSLYQLGVVERAQQGANVVTHLTRAARIAEEVGDRYTAALTELTLAELQLDVDDTGRNLERIADAFDQLAAPGEQARAMAVLAAALRRRRRWAPTQRVEAQARAMARTLTPRRTERVLALLEGSTRRRWWQRRG